MTGSHRTMQSRNDETLRSLEELIQLKRHAFPRDLLIGLPISLLLTDGVILTLHGAVIGYQWLFDGTRAPVRGSLLDVLVGSLLMAPVSLLVCVLVSLLEHRRGMRFHQRAGENRRRLAQPDGPLYCLYLRDERGSSATTRLPVPGGSITYRPPRPSLARLNQMLRPCRLPIYALWRPENNVDGLDFEPIYALDSYWQEDVLELMLRAKLIVFDTDYVQPGLQYEYDQLAALTLGNKTLLIVSSHDRTRVFQEMGISEGFFAWVVDAGKRGPDGRARFELPDSLIEHLSAQDV